MERMIHISVVLLIMSYRAKPTLLGVLVPCKLAS